uniref:Uncharacterized protein n=1 Tax=Avena sativa TaxID=4498 RepID=A0ACD5V843_AVESA
MRVLRDCQDCACAAAVLPSCPPTTQHRSIDLEDVGKLWEDWGIHGLILVSFGLQVFLLFAAGLRRCSTSRSLRSLLWLAYLSADTVAIFILGHLSIHASGPRHQLLFLWAPLVLLHLGGQHTITAFSMQDNELWRRHLLGLVTQVAVAGYVVSRSSWFDRRLLAAMVLMFLSGCLRYAERTCCLYNASPEKLKESSLAALKKYTEKFKQGYNEDTDYRLIIDEMLKADGRHLPLHSRDEISSSANTLISETPLSDLATTKASPTSIQHNLKELKSSAHSCRAYNYVSTRLVHIYELLYTKAPFLYHLCSIFSFMVFILFSTSATLVHFVVVAKKSQLYSQADVIVSYILLIGAITLEVASLFIFFPFSPDLHGIQNAVWSVGKYIHLACGTKQWSEMLGQYNMINSLTTQDDANLMSFVPQWIYCLNLEQGQENGTLPTTVAKKHLGPRRGASSN